MKSPEGLKSRLCRQKSVWTWRQVNQDFWSKEQKMKRMEKVQWTSVLWNTIQCTNTGKTGVPKGEQRKRRTGAERIFEEEMTNNFPCLMINIHPHTLKAQWTPNRINSKIAQHSQATKRWWRSQVVKHFWHLQMVKISSGADHHAGGAKWRDKQGRHSWGGKAISKGAGGGKLPHLVRHLIKSFSLT